VNLIIVKTFFSDCYTLLGNRGRL